MADPRICEPQLNGHVDCCCTWRVAVYLPAGGLVSHLIAVCLSPGNTFEYCDTVGNLGDIVLAT